MSYSIILTNGTVLTDVTNGSIDQTSTDLTLIGQNTSGYGLYVNDNFVHLLENFANTSQPNYPIIGQLWYDTSENLLKIYNGTTFEPTGNTIVANTPPSNFTTGGLWINNVTGQLFFNDGTENILAGPIYTKTQGISGFVTSTIIDTIGVSHNIVSLYVGGTLIGIYATEQFTPSSSISGYTSTATVVGNQIGTVLTVTEVISGTLSVGQTITGTGITPGTTITEFLVGPGGIGVAQGGVGTYALSTSATVSSTTISAIYGEINIGFNASTFAGIQFNVPVSQASSLLAADGSLKVAESFVSTVENSSTTGTLSIQNSVPLVLGSSGQAEILVNNSGSNAFNIQSNISGLNFEITTLNGTTYTQALFINSSSGKVGVFTNAPQATLDVNGSFRIAASTPSSSSATGAAGQIAWDANYVYVCTSTNTWKRAALSTW